MEPFQYRIVTEWSTEDEVYVARVPALGVGCAAHGDTAEDAATEVRSAAQAMLEVLREQGRPEPAPDSAADYSGQLRLRLPRSLHERLTRLAATDDVSLNSLLLVLIARGLGDAEARPAPAKAPAASAPRKESARPPARSGVREMDAEEERRPPARSGAMPIKEPARGKKYAG